MSFSDRVLKNDEKAIYALRALYKEYGYSLYKVSKFEEYDLYAHNKNFLVSNNILSFTDTNGRLLALKPDVTLSIVKNISDSENTTQKFCYNETVYRTSADSDGFREIMQTGLECIGDVDLYSECEVITLAVKSLDTISEDYILDISHMGFVEGLLAECGIEESRRNEFIGMIKSKNVHSLRTLCDKCGVASEMTDKLVLLTGMYLPLNSALPKLKELVVGEKMLDAYNSLVSLGAALDAEGTTSRIYIDFSVVNDLNYYDGICFKGFINGIPDSVLSGGRYDKLIHRLGKPAGAIGFAVYLDRLERFDTAPSEYDVDDLLVYDNDADIKDVIMARNELLKSGARVLVGHSPDRSVRYRRLLKLTKGGIETLETND